MPISATRMRRRTLLRLLGATGFCGAAGISGLIRQALADGDNPVARGMHKVTGDVTINGRPATKGSVLQPGDTIATGVGAQGIYVIGQDAFLQRDNSIIQFGADRAANVMRVITGKILSVFGKGQRTIQVSTATIGIRGTGCYIEDEPAGKATPKVGDSGTAITTSRTYFCLCYGSVELIPNASPQQREIYSTTHHDHPIYIHDNPMMPKSMVPAAVMNHTDFELTLLESIVGRPPPFAGISDRAY